MILNKMKNILRHTAVYSVYTFIKYKLYPYKLKRARIISVKPVQRAVQEKKIDGKRVIISLTSFPERICFVHKSLYSLMNQEYKPNMIILWLSKNQFPEGRKNIPDKVLELEKVGLTIRWIDGDIRSYKKLIPALKEFQDDIIVTADDDLYYSVDWLKSLINAYIIEPKSIHCHLITRLAVSEGRIGTIKREKWMRNSYSFYNKILGGSGTLYPPHSLDSEVLNERIFLDIAPTSDDIWFWAMAVLNGTKIHWIPDGMNRLYYIENTQESTPCLTHVNDQEERLFDKHINSVVSKYGILDILNQ